MIRFTANTLLTGVAFLVGATGTTDSVIVILYDNNGNVVANSALAGATVGAPAGFQAVAFTTPFQARPGLYYVGVSTNGNHATIRTQAFGYHGCGAITSQTFGTLAAITPPTTFTASQGPVACTY